LESDDDQEPPAISVQWVIILIEFL
jgi:hypothetical protein